MSFAMKWPTARFSSVAALEFGPCAARLENASATDGCSLGCGALGVRA